MHLLKRFPPISHATLYGSSILKRNPDPKSQCDLLFAVEDTLKWHTDNLKLNPTDYSDKCRQKGPGFIVDLANQAAKIHFNPFVNIEGREYKYGVVSLNDLLIDLLEWETLYLAGRFHKPMQTLISNTSVVQAQSINLRTASSLALVTLPQITTDEDFFKRVCEISYRGDRRIEDPNKINSIVTDNLHKFQMMYGDTLHSLQVSQENGIIEVFLYSAWR